MKRKSIGKVLLLILVICAGLLLIACDEAPAGNGDDTPQAPKADITGVTFADLEVTYDGAVHTLAVSGTLPQGVSVTYSDHEATDAGIYNATATLTGEGYNTLTLNATLKINKATISGITFADSTVTETGSEQSIVISGMLPEGAEVTYENNKGSKQGTYNATATITGKNYETLALHAVLKIKPDLTRLAAQVVSNVLAVPDLWAFFPEELKVDSIGYTSAPATDFASGFVPVSGIPHKVVGKQLNVVYDALNGAENVFAALQVAYASAEAITTLYQGYINQNPDDYAEYTDTTGDLRFKIKLDGNNYLLLLEIGTANLELSYDSENEVCYGRIQLTDSNAVKYEMGAGHLKLSLSIVGVSLHQIEFVRNDNAVVGYLYEYMGTESINLKTSAMIKIDTYYTTIISNKRESDDLTVEGDMEIYDNATGRLIGTEIKETVSSKAYDTKWFPLSSVSGISSIKVIPQQNGLNADTVYINGSSTPIKTKTAGLLDLSRRFDIEMKVVYIYAWNETEQEYEKQQLEIPMLFVQSEHLATFSEDFFEKNEGHGMTVAPTFTLSGAVSAYVSSVYATLISDYLEIKELVPYSSIVAYIGEKNAFFTSGDS